MSKQAMNDDPRKFTIHRNKRGSPRWYQRWLEAWWILNGEWSLHRAWQDGTDHGRQMEYTRIIVNGGDFAAQIANAKKFEENSRAHFERAMKEKAKGYSTAILGSPSRW